MKGYTWQRHGGLLVLVGPRGRKMAILHDDGSGLYYCVGPMGTFGSSDPKEHTGTDKRKLQRDMERRLKELGY